MSCMDQVDVFETDWFGLPRKCNQVIVILFKNLQLTRDIKRTVYLFVSRLLSSADALRMRS